MKSQPLKWHGGKGAFQGKLAKWILSLMPDHTHYVEPYFGGGSVLLRKNPEGVSEVANDINGNLVNFWRVLRECPEDLIKILELLPFSRDQFNAAKEASPLYCLQSAVDFFVCNRQSRQGLGKDFATLTKSRLRCGMNEQASSWWGAIEGLPEIAERLKRVVIENRPALDLIEAEDSPKTLFYLDPPYLHETRSSTGEYGANEMTWEDHLALLRALMMVEGKFLLSGYRSPAYDQAAVLCGWTRHEFDIPNNAASGKKKDTRTECIYTNVEPKE